MQELLSFVNSFQEETIHPRILKVKINELLEKEKEQIIDAYVEGGESILNDSSYMNQDFFGNSPEYYNKIYNQNK